MALHLCERTMHAPAAANTAAAAVVWGVNWSWDGRLHKGLPCTYPHRFSRRSILAGSPPPCSNTNPQAPTPGADSLVCFQL
eukprot:355086-Chlamydomonas_euryale.AAC.7